MTDIRRQSTDGRVATPKISSQGMADLDASLTKVVGARVKLSTISTTSASSSSAPDALEGTVFAACPLTNLIAINTAPPPSNPSSATIAQPGDYHIIPVSRIQSFQLAGLATDALSKGEEAATGGFEGAVPSIGGVDIKALEAREQATIARIKEKEASRGRGVTKEAQEIFDALARTLPARWHDTSIVINDAVIISKPYTVDDCAAPKDQHNALSRVKKVLENERKKIADRTGKSSTTTTGQRKGG